MAGSRTDPSADPSPNRSPDPAPDPLGYGATSYWLETAGDDLTPRPALRAEIDADVAILGAGYTGLWTAYELLRRDPSLQVVLLER